MKGQAAIVGLGITEMGRVYGRTSTDFAVEAISLALQDAGLTKDDLDGLLINTGISGQIPTTPGALGLDLQRYLGLCDLKLLNLMNAYGSTAGAMIQFAAMACATGMTKAVACVFADTPLVPNKSAGASYTISHPVTGLASRKYAYGITGANPGYAMAARRNMELY